jgi:nucleoid DNA-binding protein
MGRPKRQYRSTSKSCYEDFCKKNPGINITFQKWKEIIYSHNEMLIKHILETGQAVKLPYGFGKLSVNKKKPKATRKWNGKMYINLPIDWKKTKETGKRVYHMNTHTDGYKFRWIWFGKTARFQNSDVWNFKPARVISRLLPVYLRQTDKSYKDLYVEWLTK